jgi:hypothetical protein
MTYAFGRCPRCTAYAYEYLRTHSYCVNCNYSPDYEYTEPDVPKYAIECVKELDKKESLVEKNNKIYFGLSAFQNSHNLQQTQLTAF